MIKEEYVSFEVALLLKEKGFNEPTIGTYNIESKHHICIERPIRAIHCEGIISAPTQAMAMRWLREVHNIIISVNPFNRAIHSTEIKWYNCDIATPTMSSMEGHLRSIYKSYEEACEAAIKHCLENLI